MILNRLLEVNKNRYWKGDALDKDTALENLVPRFSRCNLLFLAVGKFNEFRKNQGKALIDTSRYNKLIRRNPRSFWILNINDPEIYEDWVEFCNNPSNKVVFRD
jgi:hypothetical protein